MTLQLLNIPTRDNLVLENLLQKEEFIFQFL